MYAGGVLWVLGLLDLHLDIIADIKQRSGGEIKDIHEYCKGIEGVETDETGIRYCVSGGAF